MSYNVLTIKIFDNQAKRLAKKFKSLKKEISDLIDLLEQEPFSGESLGKSCYKIRLKISSKGKGKSGGARVITNVYVVEETVYLLSIYDKSEQEDLSDEELLRLLSYIE
ncbi:MAG: type II toxin-antitoxin system RelE/ParE family toxin [Candidatus Kapabacteria bacterium]|nr:type II toxin-antitoxin system RelE/ParE family toxin [Candidatus Kapabacteria bacterium]